MPIETSSRLPNCARRVRYGGVLILLSVFAVPRSAEAQANLTWDVNGVTASGRNRHMGYHVADLVRRIDIPGVE